MRTATIVGAGIGGPVAAIMLSRAGYDVTVHEARASEREFNSLHQLTLNSATIGILLDLGISERELFRYEESDFIRETSDGTRLAHRESRWDPWQRNVMWD